MRVDPDLDGQGAVLTPTDAARSSPPSEATVMSSQPLRILVIDDVPEVLEMFRAIARRIPALALETENDPVRAIRRIEGAPLDVVISDYRVRMDSGARILAHAKEKQAGARRVLMSGYPSMLTTDPLLEAAQPHEFLGKPLSLETIRGALQGTPACATPPPTSANRKAPCAP